MSTTTTEPTSTHPAWCAQEPGRCDMGLHWSSRVTTPIGAVDGESGDIEVSLSQVVGEDPEPLVWLEVSAAQCITVADLERVARWLTERAAEYRAATEAEAGR